MTLLFEYQKLKMKFSFVLREDNGVFVDNHVEHNNILYVCL